METTASEAYKTTVLRNFIANDGTLRSIPAQYKKKLVILEYLVEQLEAGKEYPEKDINAFIKRYYADYATIRREFIIHQYMSRDHEIYIRNPRELWTQWEKV
ncbi:DUF2087 domain-containing protein [Paenibacillus sp. p3-SID867]|uniref:DUF2087 domain-containing protein n=1 Tax=Paenibacillus sp. p3-SID867 TaxID=2916363 RepID=UPI0021A79EA3|nr:DUF2087 domain-containing protein [Paenibacillus sp. p3-SID867]MCT1398739.1 DUF2087 domain-containing protein [Paenibacillus sp. p3-SID867]